MSMARPAVGASPAHSNVTAGPCAAPRENRLPTPHHCCFGSMGGCESTSVCQIDCIWQRHSAPRTALSMCSGFWFAEFVFNRAGGTCTLRSQCISKKASRPMRGSLLARLSRSNCEQCAKVDPKISLRSVRERSTLANAHNTGGRSHPVKSPFANVTSQSQPPRNSTQTGNVSSLQGHAQFSQS